jgi:hypothetical protein
MLNWLKNRCTHREAIKEIRATRYMMNQVLWQMLAAKVEDPDLRKEYEAAYNPDIHDLEIIERPNGDHQINIVDKN